MTHEFCEGHAGFCSTDVHDALQYISLVFLSFFFCDKEQYFGRECEQRERIL